MTTHAITPEEQALVDTGVQTLNTLGVNVDADNGNASFSGTTIDTANVSFAGVVTTPAHLIVSPIVETSDGNRRARTDRRKKVVIQCSGGVESTVLIGDAIKQFGKENVHLIAMDTDSLFWRHRDSVAVKRVVTNFQMQQQLFICRMPQVDMLEYNIDGQYQDVGFLPGYKLMYNAVAMAYAQRVGADEVWIGNMLDNVYPDEGTKFMRGLQDLYNETYAHQTGHPGIELVEPFKTWTKAEVINHGIAIGVDVFDTVSCGEERTAGGYNCGVCPWCLKRIKGFDEAGVVDETRYLFGRGTPD